MSPTRTATALLPQCAFAGTYPFVSAEGIFNECFGLLAPNWIKPIARRISRMTGPWDFPEL